MPRLWPVILAAIALFLLSTSVGCAQDAPDEKPAGRPKPSTVAIPAEKLDLKPGDPLSVRAFVLKPPPLKGVVSWSIETRRHRGLFNATSLSPDGKLIATGGLDGTVRVWDTTSGKLVRALIGHNSYVYSVDFSPDGNTLASAGSFDTTVRLWDVRSGMPLRVLKGHPTYVSHVSWSPDGKTILGAGGTSGILSRWDAVSGNYRTKIEFGQPVRSISWRADGRTAAIACATLPVQLWDDGTNRITKTLGRGNDDYHSLAWSPDGKLLAAGTSKNVFVYEGDTGMVEKKLDGHAAALAWTADGKQLSTSAVSAGLIQVWDTSAWQLGKTVHGTAWTIHYLPGEKQLIGGDYTNIAVWEIASEKALRSYRIAGSDPPLWWSGRPLVTGVGTAKLALWDATSGKLLRTLDGHGGTVNAVAWSLDGRTLAAATSDKMVRLWDTTSGKVLHTLEGHTASVLTVAFSPDGKNVASGGNDKNVLIWDVGSGKLLHTLKGHVNEVTTITWAPGTTGQLASGGNDKTVRIWNGRTGAAGKTFSDEGESQVASLAWSPDAKTLVSGHYDHRARLWQVASGKLVQTLENAGSPPQVSALAWSPNDTLLASGRANHTLQIWNVKNGQLLQNIAAMAPVQRVSWTPDSRTIGCSSADRATRFFDAATGLMRGALVAEDMQIISIGFDGHLRADTPAQAELFYVAQLDKSQETFTAAQFASKFRWKNNPAMIRLTGK